jgi:predicted lipid-binding transport protein (Tim44 family)
MSLLRKNPPSSVAGLAAAAIGAGAARLGGGKSLGSRGSRTYAPPQATKTAPGSAPIGQSMTDKRVPMAAKDEASIAAMSWSSFAGWRVLLAASLILMSAASVFGFSAIVGVVGMLLQFVLVGGAIYFVANFIRGRAQPTEAPTRDSREAPRGNTPNCSPFAFSRGAAPLATALTIGKDDFDSFERLLGEIQTSYGREDADELGARTTPEMLSYFSRDIYDNREQALRHEVSDLKLLRGELSEAWHESGSDYATLAMIYSWVTAAINRATGEVVSEAPGQSSQVVELWTFRRDDRAHDDGWQLSAIQQAAFS